jgi:hypothetical protein
MHDEGEERAGVVMGPIRPVALEGTGTVVTGTALARTVRGEKVSTSSIDHWLSSPNRKPKKFRVVCCLLCVAVSIYTACFGIVG